MRDCRRPADRDRLFTRRRQHHALQPVDPEPRALHGRRDRFMNAAGALHHRQPAEHDGSTEEAEREHEPYVYYDPFVTRELLDEVRAHPDDDHSQQP